MLNFDGPVKENKLLIPDSFEMLSNFNGKLYGYIREDTGISVIIGWDGNEPDIALKTYCIGAVGPHINEIIEAGNSLLPFYDGIKLILNSNGEIFPYGIFGNFSANSTIYYFIDKKGNKILLQKEIYSTTQDLFSRNSGLLETEKMKEKTAVIIGCGSVGSTLSLQLARSGVGKFVLADTDTLEIHNICRHQCNLTDIGRFKTDALRDRIIAINPFASVTCFTKTIENVTDKELDSFADNQSIIVSCADNRLSDAFACEIAYERKIPFVSIGFWKRAFVCEVVVCIPQRGDTCYRCALKKSIENGIENMNRNHFYIGEEDRAKVVFEPGISIDVEFGTSVASKIVLDILNLNNPNYISKVFHTLTQYTLICNTNNTAIGGDDAKLFSNPLQVVRNIHFENGTCAYCNPKN
jgi:molybdopterin/thiamine biosynthesis adenylyltransferase